MTDIRRADRTAREAFRRLLEHYLRTQEWSPALLADWHAAEDALDETPEWMLDAEFEARMAEIDELAERDAEDNGLPDIPFARWAECEQAGAYGR